MRRLKAPACLGDDFDNSFRRKLVPRILNELVECHPLQKGHDEIRLLLAVLVKLADIEDVDDVRVPQAREDGPLFFEELDGGLIEGAFYGFQGYIGLEARVEGLVD